MPVDFINYRLVINQSFNRMSSSVAESDQSALVQVLTKFPSKKHMYNAMTYGSKYRTVPFA